MARIFYTKDYCGDKYILISSLGLPPHKDLKTMRWKHDREDKEAQWYNVKLHSIKCFLDLTGIPEPEWDDEEPIELYTKPIKPGYSI